MADASQRAACHNDPDLILITKEHFFRSLCASLTYATANIPTEAPSYTVSDWIISIYCAICESREDGGSFVCCPQTRLEWSTSTTSRRYRDPDFGAIHAFNRSSPSNWLPSKPAGLIFLAEIKPPEQWQDWRFDLSVPDINHIEKHVAQISEQAYFAFRRYGAKKVYAFLIMGNQFSFFEYKMPRNLDAYAPSHKVKSSDVSGDTPPSTPPNLGKRRRVESIEGLPRMLKPRPLYAFHRIVEESDCAFSNGFLNALDITMAPHIKSRQPSWFQVPSGEHTEDENILRIALRQIDNAAEEVSGATLREDAYVAKLLHPSPTPKESKDSDFKPTAHLKRSTSQLPLTERKTRSRSNSLSLEEIGRDEPEGPINREAGPSSSGSSLPGLPLDDRFVSDDEASLPESSAPPSPTPRVKPISFSAIPISNPELDAIVAEMAAEAAEIAIEEKLEKRKGKGWKGKDKKGNDKKGKGRAV
ncbi:hypothetical protein EWM64_g5509 [Hericium alpestre]|uniref:Uncharacterized protein n=1 Tax=Hericium alpestre TaxID=135208 RepID=A0A4Y9ZWE7_9AGAM|nr:hypothetical protein EWM64_g5509 [Hericium alpestre]